MDTVQNHTNHSRDIPVVHLKRLKRRLRGWLLVNVAIVFLLAGSITWLVDPSVNVLSSNTANSSSGLAGDGLDAEIVFEPPSFSTLVPESTNIDDLGGWARVSPPGSEKVYAFTDSLSDVNIIVSQQQLPETFKDAPSDKLEEFAQSYAANRLLPTNNDANAYIGTSAKGPQSVLLIKNDLLILIKSASIISDDAWVTYINSLQ